METPSRASTYGAPFADEAPIKDPQTQQAASQYGDHALHTAQMSQTSVKAWLRFPTISAIASTTPSATRTHWGDSSSYFPTNVARTATGTYLLTYPATFANEYAASEAVSFVNGRGQVASSTVAGHVQVAVSGNTATVTVRDSSLALVDVTDGTLVDVWLS